jgi:hypothetical protein
MPQNAWALAPETLFTTKKNLSPVETSVRARIYPCRQPKNTGALAPEAANAMNNQQFIFCNFWKGFEHTSARNELGLIQTT